MTSIVLRVGLALALAHVLVLKDYSERWGCGEREKREKEMEVKDRERRKREKGWTQRTGGWYGCT